MRLGLILLAACGSPPPVGTLSQIQGSWRLDPSTSDGARIEAVRKAFAAEPAGPADPATTAMITWLTHRPADAPEVRDARTTVEATAGVLLTFDGDTVRRGALTLPVVLTDLPDGTFDLAAGGESFHGRLLGPDYLVLGPPDADGLRLQRVTP